MSGTRFPFDSSLPFVVATQDLPCGPKRFGRGDAFPWRELGLSETDLAELWVAFKIDNISPAASSAGPAPARTAQQAPPSKPQAQQRRR